MNLPQKQSKTYVTTTKTVNLSDNVSQEVLDEWKERKKALAATEALIIAELKRGTLSSFQVKDPILIEQTGTGINAQAAVSVSVDGQYIKKSGNAPGFIEASTLNLLLSSKILTPEEKRQVLADRGLLPSTNEEQNQ